MSYPDDLAVKRYFYQHYDSEACALSYLADYIQWLKDNDIYDNTQIIVVSDHSGADSIGFPLSVPYYGGDILFMFKDFHAKGSLKRDSRLMADFDTASIVCDNLKEGCPHVPKNILKTPLIHRTLIHSKPDYNYKIKEDNLVLDKLYLVHDNIYDAKNWQDITEEAKQGHFDFTQIK